MLAIRVFALWVIIGLVIGYGSGEILRISNPDDAGGRVLCRMVGAVQGVVGGFYCLVVVIIRRAKCRWLTRDWVLHGLIATVPFYLVLAIASMGKAKIGWEVSLIPVQSLLASFLTSFLINDELGFDEAS